MRNDMMRAARAVLLVFVIGVLASALSGCNGERRRVSRETHQMTEKFRTLMNDGKTTREQEKAFINAMGDVTYELDRSIRGTKSADRTRRNAKIEAQTGINPEAPMELDK